MTNLFGATQKMKRQNEINGNIRKVELLGENETEIKFYWHSIDTKFFLLYTKSVKTMCAHFYNNAQVI